MDNTITKMNTIMGQGAGEFAARFAIAMIGVEIMKLQDLALRRKDKPTSSYHFDLRHYLEDNWRDLVLTILLVFAIERLKQLFFPTKVSFEIQSAREHLFENSPIVLCFD